MRQLDKVGLALADSLGFSVPHSEARMKVICQGLDKNSGEMITITECRIRPRRTPMVNNQEKVSTKPKKKLKGPGNPKTPHQSLLQSVNQLAKETK